METQTGGRPSVPLTPALGLGVLVLIVVFAFDSAWYPHWYAFFRVIHVTAAVFWVGGGMLLTALAIRAERANDAGDLAALARQAAFAGERLFAPLGMLAFLSGIAMMINTDWGWGKFWVSAGLVGYVLSFGTGVGVLAPAVRKVERLISEHGANAPETQAAIRRLLRIARIDVAVLILVVADMVTKPFS
jgi:uncharacterized membrane protein